MPRGIRNISENSLYHIVLKGNNSQKLFFDDNDYLSFLNTLKESCDDYSVDIVAYCLMSNHIHLILKCKENNIANMFKSFGASFVYKYNRKYCRTGGLFNGRYYSKAINDESYFYTVLKYIHYNPVNAGVCNSLSEYTWSSYESYRKLFDGYVFVKELYVDEKYLFSIMDKSEFDMIHISNDEDLLEYFMIDFDVNRNSKNDVVQDLVCVKEKLLVNHSVDELLVKFTELGISKSKISKIFGIDRRRL